MKLMAHPRTEADQVFDQLAHLPGLWRFERVERNASFGTWFVWAHHPTGPSSATGVSGQGKTITEAIADLHRRMEKWSREHDVPFDPTDC